MTHTLEGHSHGILGIWLDPSPHRNRCVSGGFDADIRQRSMVKMGLSVRPWLATIGSLGSV